jgi:hypothetical protein
MGSLLSPLSSRNGHGTDVKKKKKRQHASGYVKSVAVREGNRREENEGPGSPDALGRAQ